MGRNKKKGETFLNYVVPTQYGDSNGFQAGSTFKAFVLAAAIKQEIPLNTQINSPQTMSPPRQHVPRPATATTSADAGRSTNSTGHGHVDLYTGTRSR